MNFVAVVTNEKKSAMRRIILDLMWKRDREKEKEKECVRVSVRLKKIMNEPMLISK